MTYFQLLRFAEERFKQADIADSEFDAWCIFQKVFSVDKSAYFLNRHKEAEESKIDVFNSLVEERENGRPLQYILGEWEFMDYSFKVGEGVLIPRQDTETLIEVAKEYMERSSVKTVFDLCSGSGCIGITLAKMFPDVEVYCFELSENALYYLKENKVLNHAENVKIINGDIKEGFDSFGLPTPDVIVSNPPYIISDEIKTLQSEVLKEPVMALDGGADGYDFYRVINDRWFSFCEKGAFLAVECGENQAEEISKMFCRYSHDVNVYEDYNKIERVVSALRQE